MINTVLKWILQGERPYWWVREANQSSHLPELEHLPLTCETGPGSPSGHSMSSAAVGFVVISAVIDQYVHKMSNPIKRRNVERVLWFGYACAVALISIARLRLATHFPHQVVLGASAGLAGGWLVWNLPIERLQRKHFYAFAAAMFLWAVLTYFGLQLLGVDPNRTVQLALKHCAVRAYVKMSTTPWHSVYRNSALLLATGFCATNPAWTKVVSQARMGLKQQIPIAILSFVTAQALASIPYPHQPTYIFYTCAFIKNVLIVTACLLAIPMAILRVTESQAPPQTVPVAPVRKLTASAIRHG